MGCEKAYLCKHKAPEARSKKQETLVAYGSINPIP